MTPGDISQETDWNNIAPPRHSQQIEATIFLIQLFCMKVCVTDTDLSFFLAG